MTTKPDTLSAIAEAIVPVRAHYDYLRAKRDKRIAWELARDGSVRDIARRAGLDPSFVQRIKNGQNGGKAKL